MTWKAAIEAVGQFVGSLRVAFGAFLASSFLAYLYHEDHKWVLALPILFGGILLWAAVAALWKLGAERRKSAQQEAAELMEQERRMETAIDDITSDALALLLKVRMRGITRFYVDAYSEDIRALSKSVMVRYIGHKRAAYGEANEYEIADWACEELDRELAAVEKNDPELFRRLQFDARRQM